ncbi:hypothetical protein MKS88_005134 [Plasmodium brasilianum]|uniref:Uncharacterized protein n=3 Tax=Plasmodium (Plasmodium) TaxID=418103 RepID=A0A1D3TD88_PLAMA|nr:conserved Plasmodium protein, unknown function [Plasmodium malariae]KAI4835916.1 hypothetical protein MKS88_005134 [Plasmodium brasilianum]SCP02853.1 conserved Plasmodium protein, unknown function [Plasmodium malariae]
MYKITSQIQKRLFRQNFNITSKGITQMGGSENIDNNNKNINSGSNSSSGNNGNSRDGNEENEAGTTIKGANNDEKDNICHNIDLKSDNITSGLSNIILHCDDELEFEINKMIERNVVYLNLKNHDEKVRKNNTNNSNNKTIKRIKKDKNKSKKNFKNSELKQLTQAGKDLEKKMLDEISERRKKNKIKKEQKKAKKLEGELKVGNMTVIKDITKIRKKDKKAKNKIYKLSSDVIHKILKRK